MNQWSISTVNNLHDWDKLRQVSVLDGLFYDLNFHSYHIQKSFEWQHLIMFKGDEAIAGMVGAAEDKKYISQPGASFGGLIYRKKTSINSLVMIIGKFVDYLKTQSFREIEIRLPPICYYQPESEDILLAFFQNDFMLQKILATSIISLDEDDLIKNLRSPTRRGFRKAKRTGVEIVKSNSFSDFYPILTGDRDRLNKKPTHTLEELRKLGLIFPDRLVLFLARREKNILGGLLLFLINDKVVLNFYLAQKQEARKYRVANCLALESILWAKKEGYRYYDFGTSMLDGNINYGLLRFKSGFGSKSYLRRILLWKG